MKWVSAERRRREEINTILDAKVARSPLEQNCMLQLILPSVMKH